MRKNPRTALNVTPLIGIRKELGDKLLQEQVSGIYQISCSANKKKYIGSAVNIKKRISKHLWELKNNNHFNLHLQRAYNRYGIESFTFLILEYVPPQRLIDREQYWIYNIQPEFNICLIAGSCLGCKRSDKTKKKMSEVRKGIKYTEETLLKMSESHKGILQSEISKEKKSKALMGKPKPMQHGINVSKARKGIIPYWRVGTKHTEETLIKMRGRIPPNRIERDIDAYDMNGILIHCFNTSHEAMEILGAEDGGKVHVCCRKNEQPLIKYNKGKKRSDYGYSYQGYIYKYSEELEA